jgi:hypothetical protein
MGVGKAIGKGVCRLSRIRAGSFGRRHSTDCSLGQPRLLECHQVAWEGIAAQSATSANPVAALPPLGAKSPSRASLLPQALASIDEKNFEPEVVDHIRSQRVASPRRKLRMGVISSKSPFWLPAISRLGKVS